MKKIIQLHNRCFSLIAALLIAASISAQTPLWVGQTTRCEVSPLGLISDMTWEVSGGYLKLSGSGGYRDVTATQYWSGSATVTCKWKYRLYANDTPTSTSRTWSFTCIENPVHIYPEEMVLSVGQIGYLYYSFDTNNQYTSYADAYFSTSSSIISVSKYDGVVTALKPGTAYVNVYSKISNASKAPYCKITVRDVPVEGVSISSSIDVVVDANKSLSASVSPSNATVKSTKWYIAEGSEYISLTTSGKLTGKNPGTAKIYCIVNDDVRSNTATINILEPSFSVSGSKPSNNETDISAFATPSVTYSLALFEGDSFSTIRLSEIKTGKNIEGEVSIDGNKVVFEPSKALHEQTEYRFTIPANAVKNKWNTYYNSSVDVLFKTGNWEQLTLSASAKSCFVSKGDVISLNANIPNAIIYYTLDGSTPSENNSIYTEPLKINDDTRLRAIAVCDGYRSSDILSEDYLISNVEIVTHFPDVDLYVYKDVNPYVRFGNAIVESEHLEEIVLLKNGKESLSGELIVADSTIFIIPDAPLELGCYYQIVIPADAVKTIQGESNFAATLFFKTGDYVTDIIMNGPELASIIKKDGSVHTWGNIYKYGNSKDGSYVMSMQNTPVPYLTKDVIDLSSGYMHHAFIKNDGSLWLWGRQYCGEFGNNSTIGSSIPVKVMDDVLSVSCGGQSTAIIKKDHTLWMCGRNDFGQLGDSSTVVRPEPIKVMSDISSVVAGWCVTYAVANDCSLWGWGRNDNNQLGIDTVDCVIAPIKLMDNVAIVSSSATECQWTAVIKNDGSLWVWGRTQRTPLKILDDVCSVAVGVDYVQAVRTDGSLWAFGNNTYGQLGNGSTEPTTVPVMIMDEVEKVESGGFTTMVNKQNGSVWTWGRNENGILGDSTVTSSTMYRSQPVQIIEGRSSSVLQGIKSRKNTYRIFEGNVNVIDAMPVPVNAKYNELTWYSNNNSIVSVTDRGVVKAESVGKTEVIATIKDDKGSEFSMTCNVIVEDSNGVNTINTSNIKVWARDYILYISGVEPGQNIGLHTLNGAVIYHGVADDTVVTIPINNAGVYMVRIDSYSTKVLIR